MCGKKSSAVFLSALPRPPPLKVSTSPFRWQTTTEPALK
ncbi:hypothetical protein EVA_07457 [gut metagenome]|uniref:Uncharacterized protein n=1 Tax=gut metagenome TaxID=749906 RepID=J9GC55_9ZZZZ